MSKPKIIGRDNRGDSDVQFGFVYFDDETRIGYASDGGVTMFGGNWGGNTPSHFAAAAKYLESKGPKTSDKEAGN